MFTRFVAFALVSLAGLIGLGAPSQATGPETYKVDPVHSSMLFRVKHMNASYFYGRFNDTSGTFRFDAGNPSNCAFEIEVKTASIDTGNQKRDRHLSSPDFFNVRQFPVAQFKSTQVKKAGDETYEVTGDLSLHGVTRPVTARLERTGTSQGRRGWRSGLEAVFTINRSDFGMTYGLNGLSDEVRIIASLSGIQQ